MQRRARSGNVKHTPTAAGAAHPRRPRPTVIQSLVLGSLLGIFSGVVPGPFTALIAATTLRRGFWAGFRIAVVPLLSEGVVLAATAFLLDQLPSGALGWMGMAGGLLVFYLAWKTLGESKSPPETEPAGPDGDEEAPRLLEGALLSVLSPTPWVFWLLVGAPLFLSAWRAGWGSALAFLGSFLFFLVGIYVAVAAAAAFGQRRLGATGYRRLMVATSVALFVAGAVLIWQSWVGNFEEMVAGSEAVKNAVERQVP